MTKVVNRITIVRNKEKNWSKNRKRPEKIASQTNHVVIEAPNKERAKGNRTKTYNRRLRKTYAKRQLKFTSTIQQKW